MGQALYRKYRSKSLSEIVGQEHITATLTNALKGGKISHAYLLTGPRGVGKTSIARILAHEINGLPYGDEAHLDIIEIDAASNRRIDEIRDLRDRVNTAPSAAKYKVYIIDEVHMLSTSAFNAFLKTLEEPPAHAIFILATTEKHKIIPTILSRCQIFDFQRIRVRDIAEHLMTIATKENVTADPDALHLIAQKADGALRDALSIFDQIVSFAGTNVTHRAVLENLNILDHDYYFKVVENALNEDIPANLLLFNEVMEKGFDGHHFVSGLADHVRNLLVCKDPRTVNLLEVGEMTEKQFLEQSKRLDAMFAIRSLAVLSKTDVDYKASRNQRLLVEMALMQICSLKNELEKKKS